MYLSTFLDFPSVWVTHRPDRVVKMQAQHTIKYRTTDSRASVRETGDGGIALHGYEHQYMSQLAYFAKSEGLARTNTCGYIPTSVLPALGAISPAAIYRKAGQEAGRLFPHSERQKFAASCTYDTLGQYETVAVLTAAVFPLKATIKQLRSPARDDTRRLGLSWYSCYYPCRSLRVPPCMPRSFPSSPDFPWSQVNHSQMHTNGAGNRRPRKRSL